MAEVARERSVDAELRVAQQGMLFGGVVDVEAAPEAAAQGVNGGANGASETPPLLLLRFSIFAATMHVLVCHLSSLWCLQLISPDSKRRWAALANLVAVRALVHLGASGCRHHRERCSPAHTAVMDRQSTPRWTDGNTVVLPPRHTAHGRWDHAPTTASGRW